MKSQDAQQRESRLRQAYEDQPSVALDEAWQAKVMAAIRQEAKDLGHPRPHAENGGLFLPLSVAGCGLAAAGLAVLLAVWPSIEGAVAGMVLEELAGLPMTLLFGLS
ncbi:MAG: hypothetical protein AB1634_06975 [Thermodesulfobacteriota bacterium]